MRRLLFIIFVFGGLGLASFFLKGGKKTGSSFTVGDIKDRTYSNDFFRMKLKVPEYWYVYPKTEGDQITHSGSYFPLWDSNRGRIWLRHNHTPPKILLMMSSHKMGTRGLGNAFFYMWVEKQSDYPEQFENGAEFLAFSRMHRKYDMPVIKKIIGQKITIGGKQFYYSEEILNIKTKPLNYRKYACKWGEYFFVFLTPHTQFAEMSIINNCLKSVRFQKQA